MNHGICTQEAQAPKQPPELARKQICHLFLLLQGSIALMSPHLIAWNMLGPQQSCGIQSAMQVVTAECCWTTQG